MEVDVDEFNRDVAAICDCAGDTPENRNAAAFLLAVMYLGNHPRRIAQLAQLSRELTRYYLDNVAKYMLHPRHGFICQWPDEKRGPMSFILDMLVIEGKVSRKYDEKKGEFYYGKIPDDERTQPKKLVYHKRQLKPEQPKYAIEVKLSARREGLVPMKK
jgi:hypothetical protein